MITARSVITGLARAAIPAGRRRCCRGIIIRAGDESVECLNYDNTVDGLGALPAAPAPAVLKISAIPEGGGDDDRQVSARGRQARDQDPIAARSAIPEEC